MDRLEVINQTWEQVGMAIGMDRHDDAALLAGAAMDISGWDHASWEVYPRAMALCGVEVRMCRGMPRDWLYYYHSGRWHQLLLVAPGNAEMVADVWDFGALMRCFYRRGRGVWRLSEVLAEVLFSAMEAPDDASDAL